jgi:hypothetical protein
MEIGSKRMGDGRRDADDLAGTELASEMLPDHQLALLAFLVRGDAEDAPLALELGAWSVAADGRLADPARPLVFPLAEVDRVRALAERAAAALRHPPRGEAAGVLLAAGDGGLGVTASRAPDGTWWVTLGRADGAGVAAVPAGAIDGLVRVLAEAERELVELGLVPFPGGVRG